MNSNQSLALIIAKKELIKKYNCPPVEFYSNLITSILNNNKAHFISSFKDYLIYDDDNEFLKRYYKSNESQRKLLSYFEFYEMNSKIFPNYVTLYESKYLFKNIKRKQKMLDNLREIEENQNVSQSTQSEIFTFNALGSLCSISIAHLDEDNDIDSDSNCGDPGSEGRNNQYSNNNDHNEISVYRLIDEINKYDYEEDNYNDKLLKDYHIKKIKKNSNNRYVNYYKKYIKEDYNMNNSNNKMKITINTKTKNKTKSTNKSNKDKISCNNNDNTDTNKPHKKISSLIKATEIIKVLPNNNNHMKKKKESKVVLALKNDIPKSTSPSTAKTNDKRVSSTSYPKRSKQGKKIVVVPFGKENTTSVINKKYTKKIDVASINQNKQKHTSLNNVGLNNNNINKYSQGALTERNQKPVINDSSNNNNNLNHVIKNNHLTKSDCQHIINTSSHNSLSQLLTNKIKKNEAKSMPKSKTKDALNLFSQENSLLKSSINPRISKCTIENKSKPIIILKDSLSSRANSTNLNHNIKEQPQQQKEQIANIESRANVSLRINRQNNYNNSNNNNNNNNISNSLYDNNSNQQQNNGNDNNKKYNPFNKGIPNLHIKFNTRRSVISKSKEKGKGKGNQKKSNINNATNNTTHTINESINNNIKNKSTIVNKKQSMHTQLQQQQNKYKTKELIRTNHEEKPQTERLMNISNKITQWNNSSTNTNTKVFKINDQGIMKRMINKNDSITAIAQKFNHFKSSNSSINNSYNNKTILNETTTKVNAPFTTRTEHSNPHVSNKNNNYSKKNKINTISASPIRMQKQAVTKGHFEITQATIQSKGIVKDTINIKYKKRRLNSKKQTLNI